MCSKITFANQLWRRFKFAEASENTLVMGKGWQTTLFQSCLGQICCERKQLFCEPFCYSKGFRQITSLYKVSSCLDKDLGSGKVGKRLSAKSSGGPILLVESSQLFESPPRGRQLSAELCLADSNCAKAIVKRSHLWHLRVGGAQLCFVVTKGQADHNFVEAFEVWFFRNTSVGGKVLPELLAEVPQLFEENLGDGKRLVDDSQGETSLSREHLTQMANPERILSTDSFCISSVV